MSNFRVGQLYDPTFKKLNAKEVKDNLEAVCYKSEERSYSVNLSEEQVAIREHQYTKRGIQITELNAEKKRINKEFTDQINSLREENKEIGDAVKFRSEQREGVVFLLEDEENEQMAVFDTEGVCVQVRPMTAMEKQRVIKIAN